MLVLVLLVRGPSVSFYFGVADCVQFILPLFLSISLLKSSSWLAMLLVITRNNVLSHVTCNLPFETMRSTHEQSNPDHTLTRLSSRLNKLLGDVVISQGGVVPHIDPALLPSKSNKGKKEGASQEV